VESISREDSKENPQRLNVKTQSAKMIVYDIVRSVWWHTGSSLKTVKW